MSAGLAECLSRVGPPGVPAAKPLLTPGWVARQDQLRGPRPFRIAPVVMACGKGILLRGTFTITGKGHGVLDLGGLSIGLYDAHDDGCTFEGFLLRTEVKDADGDGLADLVVRGVACLTAEGLPAGGRQVPIRAVFRVDPVTHCLIQVEGSPHLLVSSDHRVEAPPRHRPQASRARSR